MNKPMAEKGWWWAMVVTGVALVLAGCMPFWFRQPPVSLAPVPTLPPLEELEQLDPETRSLLNGERIYFTGYNIDGERIRIREGPDWGGMMMTNLSCASCHGADAKGGPHIMHMSIMDAPDIRIAALARERHEEADPGMDEVPSPEVIEDPTQVYTLEDFRRAVVEGLHPDGEPLNPNMPRWILSERDLRDLYNYLASLPYP